MKSAIDHLRVAQENAFRDPNIGFDFEFGREDTEVTRTIREGILAEVIGSDLEFEFPGDGLNLRRNLQHMASTLHYDLREKIPPA